MSEEAGRARGVIVGYQKCSRGDTLYFINTPQGVAVHATEVIYPRVHEHSSSVELGAYLAVDLAPPVSGKPKQSLEVERFQLIPPPKDHEVHVQWSRVVVRCNVCFVRYEKGWYLFRNEYLGLIGVRATSALQVEKNYRIGCGYRAACRRTKGEEVTRAVHEPVVWEAEEVEYANRCLIDDRWLEGLVTQVREDSLFITSVAIPSDVVLFDWRQKTTDSAESLVGRWLRFQVESRRAQDHGLRYRARENFSEIPAVLQTRVRSGLPEILVRCEWRGEEEDGRPLLHSEMGAIRDHEGILRAGEEGVYELWVVKHYRQNHSARWKVSIYADAPVRIESREQDAVAAGGGEPVRDRGRVAEIMEQILRIPAVRAACLENERRTTERILQLLKIT